MGISHPAVTDDADLVAIVNFLESLGVELDDLVGIDLTYVAGPLLIRPNATMDRSLLEAGADPEFTIKAARALGFGPQDNPGGLTPEEVEAILFFESLRPLLGDEDLLALLRVLGTAMSRIARSVVSTLRVNYEMPILEETGSLLEVARAYSGLIDEMLPSFLGATSTLLRRHLATITARPAVWAVDERGATTLEVVTVGFVDLVGFTSFTERADALEFIEALTRFEALVNEAVVGNGGTLVKMLGDEAMFVAPTPAAGLTIARRLASLELFEPGPSTARIGLAAGQVVTVGGDFYGTVVNTASRIQRLSEPDTIVVTQAVVDGAHATMRFEPLGAHRLRGISQAVDLFRLCD